MWGFSLCNCVAVGDICNSYYFLKEGKGNLIALILFSVTNQKFTYNVDYFYKTLAICFI